MSGAKTGWCSMREVILGYLKKEGMSFSDLNVVMELGSSEAIKGAVETGMGITILSRATIQKELRLGTLAEVIIEPAMERPFSFVHQKQKFRLAATDELLKFARDKRARHMEDATKVA